MNFEAISKYRFEPIEKSASFTQEVIRISGGHVTLTKGLYERMNNPAFLSFGYDSENKAVGVRTVDTEEPNTTPCRIEVSGTVRLNNSAYIANWLYDVMKVDPDNKAIILKRGVKVNEYYVFELKYAEVVNKNGRKKNAGLS